LDAPELCDRLKAIVGNPAVMTEPAEMDAYVSEPRDLYRGRALCIVRPKDAREVATVLALCNERGVGVVPQGGNTGLVGGQTPDQSGRQIILSLQRLDRIRDIDPASDAMTLEAGVTLARAQETAQAADRFFPLSLASEGSCTIGGNLATNAGGVHVLAYGAGAETA
jgi:FAD/FMN-containing dehydrogenase